MFRSGHSAKSCYDCALTLVRLKMLIVIAESLEQVGNGVVDDTVKVKSVQHMEKVRLYDH